ncbi:MAG TPA: cysteine synthase A [Bacteroidales bacterium]|nr:cysteine synthase A [Bacteroidales bacterium]
MKFNNVLESIGNTPHIRLSGLFPGLEVWLKDERRNPGGSIKDRIALAMVEDAERKGLLAPGGVIIEPTSGNTGIGLAMTGAAKGYRVVLTMPESMSMERRKLLQAYGAELVLTPKTTGMKGAIEKAAELVSQTPGAWMPMQFENPQNPLIHEKTTAMEIVSDFPEGVDYLITGVGTGGHISGVGKVLKEKFPGTQVYAVEPEDSPVLSGGSPGPHPIQGIGAGFIPATYSGIADRVIKVSGKDAFTMAGKAARTEGLLVGISTGASLAAIRSLEKELPSGSRILTFAYDSGERYLSVENLWL